MEAQQSHRFTDFIFYIIEATMTKSNPHDNRLSQPNTKTEADMKSVDGKSGQSNKSSHDAMSHNKAGTHEGAGGGKKRDRDH